MNNERRTYADGTYLDVEMPWCIYQGGQALCTDGVLRRLRRIATTSDTFFSIPASVDVTRAGKRHTVSGYVTFDENGAGEQVVKFVAYTYGKNGHLLPGTKIRPIAEAAARSHAAHMLALSITDDPAKRSAAREAASEAQATFMALAEEALDEANRDNN